MEQVERVFYEILQMKMRYASEISGKRRQWPRSQINQGLASFLKELKLITRETGFVLPQIPEWRRGEAAEILRAFQKDLGITETNFHALRASFITHLLLKGIPVTTVQLMVGHSELKTTQCYVRLVASDLKGATDVLSLSVTSTPATVIPLRPIS